MTQDDLRYPIGQFEHEGEVSAEELRLWTGQIEAFPEQLREVAEALSLEQLKTQYRPGGWTLCQVLHHLPDSHLNAYLRFKWALTEQFPTIKPYDEKASAELAVCRDPRVDSSLLLLDALHLKWVELIRSLSRDDLGKRFMHPELGPVELAWSVGHYAWHGCHHLAHITTAIER